MLKSNISEVYMNRKGVIVGSAVLVFLIAATTVVSNGQSYGKAFNAMKSKLDSPRRENRAQPLENKG